MRPIHATKGWLLNSVERPELLARVSAASLALMLPGLVLAATISGLEAVAWVMLAEMVLAAAVLAYLAARYVDVSVRRQWQALRPVLLAAVCAWLVTYLIARVTDDLVAVVGLVASLAAGALAYAGAVQLLEPRLLAQMLVRLRELRPSIRARCFRGRSLGGDRGVDVVPVVAAARSAPLFDSA